MTKFRGLASILGISWLLFFGAVQAGMAIPEEEILTAIPDAADLDYSTLPGSLAPLSSDFIAQVLGLPLGGPDDIQDGGGETTVAGIPPASSSLDPVDSPPERTEVTHPPTNDDVDDAYPVSSIPFTARSDSSEASREPGEPSDCAPAGRTLWYRYDPQRTTGLVATTVGTSQAATLGVFTGSSLDGLRLVGCDTDLAGDAHVGFESVVGSTYFFQVAASTGGGPTVFTLDPAGVTERISLNSDGEETDAARHWMGVTSADGRYVAFQSLSSDLVPGDTNAAWDIFVKDRLTERIERVSVATDGTEGNDHSSSLRIDISADGRFVTFYSWADNLVPGDTNDQQDAFVHDRLTHKTTRVSVSSSGRQGEKFAAVHVLLTPARAECRLRPRDAPFVGQQTCIDWTPQASISADGCVVLFESALLGLIDGEDQEPALVNADVLPPYHVYARDRCRGETTRVSVNVRGEPGNAVSSNPSVSDDGRFVVFKSAASNLVPGVDPDGVFQLFLADRVTGEVRLVTEGVRGGPSNGQAFTPDISADGRVVAFASLASDLVSGDRNDFSDLFAYDVGSETIELVSVSTDGEQQQVERDLGRANLAEIYALVSGDGRYVAFDSPADNLSARDEPRTAVPTTTGCLDDVFLRDREAGTTLLMSVNSRGQQANRCSYVAGLTPDVAEVLFVSSADNLVDDDTNGGRDLFVHSLGVNR